jgi:hypothetical protein
MINVILSQGDLLLVLGVGQVGLLRNLLDQAVTLRMNLLDQAVTLRMNLITLSYPAFMVILFR